ncbi:LysR family transcriptional regulator [Variovorax sp. PBS-H4]|uniref:LysR family transcriptional regulator n=1 Tax=Variovorax sp. PBS-H4 TaxID=434008 RepID=UPI0018D78C0A|nr:LysR family transcriptional regulator [Variovorax sp. PBS-H4]
MEWLLTFTETVKHGSFAAAARELGTTPSTVAKAVARLESTLRLRLFHRTTRRVTLTSDGERLFDRCQRVISEIEELQAEALGTLTRPCGTLRVDLPVVFGRERVMPAIIQLAAKHPELRLDVRLSDAFVDLVEEGVDLAIRIGAMSDSRLVARRIASQDWVLCAAPAYLDAQGRPEDVSALAGHRAILFRMPTSGRDQVWHFREGRRQRDFRAVAHFRFSDGEAMAQAAELGLGIAQLPDYMVNRQLDAGTLIELLPNCRPPSTPIHAVMPANRMVPARVRAILDELTPLASASAQRACAA